MPSANFQFHAESSELVGELLPEWLAGLDVDIAIEPVLGDHRREVIQVADLRARAASEEPVGRLFVSGRGFSAITDENLSFQRANPGFFVVTPREVRDEGLRESAMGFVNPHADDAAAWRRIVARARRGLDRGAVAIGPSGDRHPEPSHRYSAGAARLHASGVTMLAIAGSVSFELGL